MFPLETSIETLLKQSLELRDAQRELLAIVRIRTGQLDVALGALILIAEGVDGPHKETAAHALVRLKELEVEGHGPQN